MSINGNVQSARIRKKEGKNNLFQRSIAVSMDKSNIIFSFFFFFWLCFWPLSANLPCKKPRCISQAIAKNSFERCFQITDKVMSNKMANYQHSHHRYLTHSF